MPGIWEKYLRACIRQVPGWRAGSKVLILPPWDLGGTRAADLTVSGPDGRFYIVDAKYSFCSGPPSPAYINQVYVYGRMAGVRLRTTQVGLVYLKGAGAEEFVEQLGGPFPIRDAGVGPLDLHVVAAAFPAADQFMDPGAVAGHMRLVGHHLIECLSAQPVVTTETC